MKRVQERNKNNTPSPSGISCIFIKVEEEGFEFGIKTYRDKDTRDICCSRQTHMSEHGYAPKTYGSFELPSVGGDDDYKYCYITELAKPVVEGFNEEMFDSTSEFKNWEEQEAVMTYEQKMKLWHEVSVLCSKMCDKGYYMGDRHFGNFGHMKNGTLVCIDFGI
jgi:hypothetical protein